MKIDKYFHLWGDKDGTTIHFDEIEPPKKYVAEWIRQDDRLYRCSWCSGLNHGIEKRYYQKSKYCPDCGTEMLRGEE